MYNNILNAFFGSIWAATPEYTLAAIEFANSFLINRTPINDLMRHESAEEEIRFQGALNLGRTGSDSVLLLENGTAVVPIQGMIVPKMSSIGLCMQGTSMDRLTARVRELKANDAVKNVVLDIHSGGGSVLGVPEAAEAIRELATVKPVTASINMIAGSAAYWLASAANKRFITQSGVAGSIGVYAVIANQAERLKDEGIDARILRAGKFKAMPNGIEAFVEDDAGLAMVQGEVNRIYEEFTQAISTNLGISMPEAKALADGSTKTGQEAISVGLADEKGDLTVAIAEAGETKLRSGEASAQASNADPVTAVSEERAEEISASIGEASDELASGKVDGLATENVEAEIAEFEALKAENEELKAQLDAMEKSAQDSAKALEEEKINALIATATTDGRIVLAKATEMLELGLQIGFEKFEAMISAIPVPAQVEDLSVAPTTEAKDDSSEDKFAPATESERKLFAMSPTLAKKYNL